jgi:hypothetical protein
MRMPGKARQVVSRNIVAKVIKQQERVEFRGAAEPKSAAKMHTCPLKGRLRGDEFFNRPQRHGGASGNRTSIIEVAPIRGEFAAGRTDS